MAIRLERAHAEIVGEHEGLLGGAPAGSPPGESHHTVMSPRSRTAYA